LSNKDAAMLPMAPNMLHRRIFVVTNSSHQSICGITNWNCKGD